MATFEKIETYHWGIVAILRDIDSKTFKINEKSLKSRINNLKNAKEDTHEEEKALKALREANIVEGKKTNASEGEENWKNKQITLFEKRISLFEKEKENNQKNIDYLKIRINELKSI